jgi:hypothetical protein
MKGMKSGLLSIVAFALCSMVFTVGAQTAEAAVLKFDPKSVTVTNGNTFEVDVIVDAEGEQISGTDAYILYDSTLLKTSTNQISPGTYFPVVSSTVDTEKIYINGVVTDPTDFKTGSGVLATITFTMLRDGNGALQFYCDTSQPDTSKIVKNDVDATNVIKCANLSIFSINGGTSTPQDGTTLPATGGTSGGIKQTTQYVQPTALPQSGVFENVVSVAVPGAIMLVLGVLLKLFI